MEPIICESMYASEENIISAMPWGCELNTVRRHNSISYDLAFAEDLRRRQMVYHRFKSLEDIRIQNRHQGFENEEPDAKSKVQDIVETKPMGQENESYEPRLPIPDGGHIKESQLNKTLEDSFSGVTSTRLSNDDKQFEKYDGMQDNINVYSSPSSLISLGERDKYLEPRDVTDNSLFFMNNPVYEKASKPLALLPPPHGLKNEIFSPDISEKVLIDNFGVCDALTNNKDLCLGRYDYYIRSSPSPLLVEPMYHHSQNLLQSNLENNKSDDKMIQKEYRQTPDARDSHKLISDMFNSSQAYSNIQDEGNQAGQDDLINLTPENRKMHSSPPRFPELTHFPLNESKIGKTYFHDLGDLLFEENKVEIGNQMSPPVNPRVPEDNLNLEVGPDLLDSADENEPYRRISITLTEVNRLMDGYDGEKTITELDITHLGNDEIQIRDKFYTTTADTNVETVVVIDSKNEDDLINQELLEESSLNKQIILSEAEAENESYDKPKYKQVPEDLNGIHHEETGCYGDYVNNIMNEGEEQYLLEKERIILSPQVSTIYEESEEISFTTSPWPHLNNVVNSNEDRSYQSLSGSLQTLKDDASIQLPESLVAQEDHSRATYNCSLLDQSESDIEDTIVHHKIMGSDPQNGSTILGQDLPVLDKMISTPKTSPIKKQKLTSRVSVGVASENGFLRLTNKSNKNLTVDSSPVKPFKQKLIPNDKKPLHLPNKIKIRLDGPPVRSASTNKIPKKRKEPTYSFQPYSRSKSVDQKQASAGNKIHQKFLETEKLDVKGKLFRPNNYEIEKKERGKSDTKQKFALKKMNNFKFHEGNQQINPIKMTRTPPQKRLTKKVTPSNRFISNGNAKPVRAEKDSRVEAYYATKLEKYTDENLNQHFYSAIYNNGNKCNGMIRTNATMGRQEATNKFDSLGKSDQQNDPEISNNNLKSLYDRYIKGLSWYAIKQKLTTDHLKSDAEDCKEDNSENSVVVPALNGQVVEISNGDPNCKDFEKTRTFVSPESTPSYEPGSDHDRCKLDHQEEATEYKRSFRFYSPLELCSYKSFKDKITKDHIFKLFRKVVSSVSSIDGDEENDNKPDVANSNDGGTLTTKENVTSTVGSSINNDNKVSSKQCESGGQGLWMDIRKKLTQDHLKTQYEAESRNKDSKIDFMTEYLKSYGDGFMNLCKRSPNLWHQDQDERVEIVSKPIISTIDGQGPKPTMSEIIKAKNTRDHIKSYLYNYNNSSNGIPAQPIYCDKIKVASHDDINHPKPVLGKTSNCMINYSIHRAKLDHIKQLLRYDEPLI